MPKVSPTSTSYRHQENIADGFQDLCRLSDLCNELQAAGSGYQHTDILPGIGTKWIAPRYYSIASIVV